MTSVSLHAISGLAVVFQALYVNTSMEMTEFHILSDSRADLQAGEEHDKMIRAGMSYVSEKLEFLPHLNTKAIETLRAVDKKLRKRKKYDEEAVINYIGIHNRRTDYSKYADKKWNMEDLDEDYFEQAMDSYR